MRDFFEAISSLFLYLFKYAWVLIILLLLIFIVLIAVLSVLQKRKIVKKEREKYSKLLQMSYEDENSKSVARRIDGETPDNKKYCPLCHALTDKSGKICKNCGYEFKEDEKENKKVDY